MLEDRKKDLTKRLQEKNSRLVLQQSAEKYEKILEKEKEIARLQQSLENASKDQEELLRNLNIIRYSLKLVYEKEFASIRAELDKSENEIKRLTESIESGRKQASICQTEINKLNVEMGAVQAELSNFEKEETDILAFLGVQIFRNPLLKELDKSDLKKAEAQLLKERQDTEANLNENIRAEEKLCETISSLEMRIKELEKEQTQLKIEETEINSRISGWESDRQKLLETLRRLNIAEEYIFDPLYLSKEAKAHLNDWENKA